MAKHPDADARFREAVPIIEEFALRHRLTVDRCPRYVSGDQWWRNAVGTAGGRRICFQIEAPDPVASPLLAIRFWIWLGPGFPERDGWWCGDFRSCAGNDQLAAKLEEAVHAAARMLKILIRYARRGHRTRTS